MEDRSKELPVIAKKVDHLNSIATAIGFTFLIPVPLALAFGSKVLVPFGAIACIVAVIRFVNNPDNIQAKKDDAARLEQEKMEELERQKRFAELMAGEQQSDAHIMNGEMPSDVHLGLTS